MCITITKTITAIITLSHTVHTVHRAMTGRGHSKAGKAQVMKSNLHYIGNIGNTNSGCTFELYCQLFLHCMTHAKTECVSQR